MLKESVTLGEHHKLTTHARIPKGHQALNETVSQPCGAGTFCSPPMLIVLGVGGPDIKELDCYMAILNTILPLENTAQICIFLTQLNPCCLRNAVSIRQSDLAV